MLCSWPQPALESQRHPRSPLQSNLVSHTGAHRRVTQTYSTLFPWCGLGALWQSDCCWWGQRSSHSHRTLVAGWTHWRTCRGSSRGWTGSCLGTCWGPLNWRLCRAEWGRPPGSGHSVRNHVECLPFSLASQFLEQMSPSLSPTLFGSRS